MADDAPTLFSPSHKLFLLDGMALTYRAHFALIRSPRYTSTGQCTSAVFGILGAVLDIIKKEEPSHIACVFDTADPTQRHIEYPEYKAQRDEMPEDLSSQLPLVDQLLDALNIPTIRIPGYEADDIIGTLAKQAAEDGFESWLVTPDKDYHQLVSEQIQIYKPGRRGGAPEILGVKEVLSEWEVERVEQVIDVLGMMGDSSDNVPGIPGIGPKTAKKLVAQFGSLEGLLDNIDKLKGKQKERVEQNVDQARLSKRLVTIQLDVPHSIELESLRRIGRNDDKLRPLLMELEFETFGKRLFGKSFSIADVRNASARQKRRSEIQQSLFDEPGDQKSLEDVPHEYTIVADGAARAELIRRLESASEFAMHVLPSASDPRKSRPVGLAFALKAHEAFFVSVPEEADERAALLDEFGEVFCSPTATRIGHEIKADLATLKWNGFEIDGPLVDTWLVHLMTEPEMQHSLESLAGLYLNYRTQEGIESMDLGELSLEQLSRRACERVDVTLQIHQKLRPMVSEREAEQVCFEVECPLVPALLSMEREGIKLDVDAIAAYSGVLQNEIDQLTERIHEAAGREFNIDSPKQLGVVLYEDLELEKKPKKTSTGQYSTRESELERLAAKHPIVADVLDYRNATKLKATYVDQLPHSVDAATGRLHTHYSQTWTSTGRLQSNAPNLQTIPVRKERGREIRAAFVPRDKDHLILSADYSQIELRIMAELSRDESMVAAFTNQEDIHSVTASKVFKVEPR